MKRLSHLLPGIRWVPHDIEPPTSSRNEKERPKRSKLGVKSASKPNHGALKKRKSVISLTDEVDEHLDAKTNAQGQSLFFTKLPLEIRKMVYEYVVGEETVHLLFAKKSFSHFVCPVAEEQDECDCKVLVGGAHCQRLSSACIRMLVACRRMYTEAAPHLYAPHTFSLLHITHLLFLPSHVPQQRLNTIRVLRLKWAIRGLPYFTRSAKRNPKPAYPEDTANWEKGWNILASMRGLRDLKVAIVDPSPDGIWQAHWLSMEERLLESVKKVTQSGLRRFELVMPYTECRLDWDMGDCKVRLRRPVEVQEEEISA